MPRGDSSHHPDALPAPRHMSHNIFLSHAVSHVTRCCPPRRLLLCRRRRRRNMSPPHRCLVQSVATPRKRAPLLSTTLDRRNGAENASQRRDPPIMSDGEGEDSFWGDRRDRRRRGMRSDSRSPSNRRSPSPPRSPGARRSEQRRLPSPSRRYSHHRRGDSPSPSRRHSHPRRGDSPSPPRRYSHNRRRDSPSPSRRPRSPQSTGRYTDRYAPPRSAESRYDGRDGPSHRRRSPSPYRNPRSQYPVNESHRRPRSRSRERRPSPPRGHPEHRPMPDPMNSPTMLGSRDFRLDIPLPTRPHAVFFTLHLPGRGSSGLPPPAVLLMEKPALPPPTRPTASLTRNKR